jgi:hypothetical protein
MDNPQMFETWSASLSRSKHVMPNWLKAEVSSYREETSQFYS